MVKRPSPVAVHLVDVGAVLQQELAGRQGVLVRKQENVSCRFRFFRSTVTEPTSSPLNLSLLSPCPDRFKATGLNM